MIQTDRTIYCLGEAIYDIILKGGKPVDGKVGGALLNTAVSLGRVGLPVEYIGDTGEDSIGDLMRNFLTENAVGTKSFISYPGSRSRLAVAFIDDINAPKYVFYKLNTPQAPRIQIPDFKKDDILVFGSFFGIKASIRPDLIELLNTAKEKGVFIIYDPNYRVNHLPLLDEVKPFILENISYAHITKGSNDDFRLMFEKISPEATFKLLRQYTKETLMYTANKDGVYYELENEIHHFAPKPIAPLSAIGAGDAFNAGLAYSIYHMGITVDNREEMIPKHLTEMVKIADSFAKDVCLSFDNYVGEKTVGKYRM